MNLGNKISSEDVQRVKDMRNHPQYDSDFGDGGSSDDDFGDLFGDSGGDSMDDLFGNDDDFFGDNSSGGFGDSDLFGNSNDGFGNSNDGFGNSNSFGSNDGFGNSGFGNNNGFGNSNGFGSSNSFGSPFGQQAGALPGQSQQSDTMDKLMDAGVNTAKTVGEILLELAKSIKLRNIDDFGFLSRNSIIAGGVFGIIGLLSVILGGTSGITTFGMSGMGGQVLLCGGLLASCGVIGLGVSALVLENAGATSIGTINDIPQLPSGEDNFSQEYEDNIGDELDDLFGNDEGDDDFFNDDNDMNEDNEDSNDSDDDDLFTTDEPEEDNSDEEEFEPSLDLVPQELNLDEQLENIKENQVMSRQLLFNTFVPMFPTCTPQFADIEEIDKDSEEFSQFETICLKALSNIANVQIEELNSYLESVKSSFFSYELRVKRVNKVKKVEELAREIEVYTRDDADDDSVNATVAIEGDFYKITVTKGVRAVVTFGDVFRHQYCKDFFLNPKNKLPVILGIDELGNVLLGEGKNYDTAMIAGKPRSGKSWYVLSILMCLMLFNTPEEVQFIIIDPKESNLFKTMALMPHVAGLHNDEHILDILDDIIDNEAPRRKKLLADNRVDDIWGLRKKGIMIPVLYVVIDEYITLINNLKASDDKDAFKDFNTKIQIFISQLPSLGLRLIFVPHRAKSIVERTNRTMIQLTACVRSEIDDVKDTLGVTKWDRALTNPGDIALKSSDMKNPAYVRGAALTNDDNDNAMFMETAAKAFYKMGVVLPDMSTMRVAVNRDEDAIRAELSGQNVIQYNAADLEEEASGDLTLSIDQNDIVRGTGRLNTNNNDDSSGDDDTIFDDDFDDDLISDDDLAESLDDDDIDVDI